MSSSSQERLHCLSFLCLREALNQRNSISAGRNEELSQDLLSTVWVAKARFPPTSQPRPVSMRRSLRPCQLQHLSTSALLCWQQRSPSCLAAKGFCSLPRTISGAQVQHQALCSYLERRPLPHPSASSHVQGLCHAGAQPSLRMSTVEKFAKPQKTPFQPTWLHTANLKTTDAKLVAIATHNDMITSV